MPDLNPLTPDPDFGNLFCVFRQAIVTPVYYFLSGKLLGNLAQSGSPDVHCWGPRSMVGGRSDRPCDDGCEVQRVAQLGAEREVPGAHSLPPMNFTDTDAEL